MTTPVDKLMKILRLEVEENFQDRAVIGGLGRFAEAWLRMAESAFDAEASDWVEEVAEDLRSYSRLQDREQRKAALKELVTMLKQGPPSTAEQREEEEEEEKERKPSPTTSHPPAPTSTPSPPESTSPPSPASREQLEELREPISALRGVGKRQKKRLGRLGIATVRDLLYFFPRRYDDFSHLKPINRLEYGEEVTIIAKVQDTSSWQSRSGTDIFKATLSDGTGDIEITWFNQPYLAKRITSGRQIVISGEVDEYMGRLCFTSPEWEPLKEERLHTGRIVPVYPLTEGLSARWLRRLVKRTVDHWAPRLPDHLPASVRERYDLPDLSTALQQIHFPDSLESLKRARHRLAFDELFVFQLGLLRQRHLWKSESGRELTIEDETLQAFVLSLPFRLTSAQQRTLGEIVNDMRSSSPMNRLLQGDVGSGKTVVAAAAMALTAAAGAQAAMMAPTEILAEQHYATLNGLLEDLSDEGPTIRLLTGSVAGEEREEVYAGLADGTVDIAVGTHALIQEGVTFHDLAFVVIDEQHRFGVQQRATLRNKGGSPSQPYNPHLLVMTATPIPRSLQLTLWGHLDVSVIDEMPPGREPVATRLIFPRERERAYAFVRSQVEKGHQAFVICPLVEESEKIEAKAAVEEYERLQEKIFPDIKLGLLHGRMRSDEKEAVMAAFAHKDLDILVATSVVEVGIDVPNATVMLIEGAERFGLAQLHQFRGRVGRGEHASYCLLVSDSASPEAEERLKAVEATNDGFALARKDLQMRGPGEFLGTRQSGMPDLRMATLADLELIERAREAARRFFQTDPELTHPEHRLLTRRLKEMWEEGELS